MKKSILYFASLPFFFLSCEKSAEPYFTSFNLEMRNYYNGDSIGNVPFTMNGIYTSEYDFGFYNKGFEHLGNTNFDCVVDANSNYFLANRSGQIVGGENTEIVVDLIPLANFGYNFDCSAPGSAEIQNVKREILYPFVPNEFVFASGYGQENTIYYPDCGASSYYQKVFSGTWIVSYQKKTSSGSFWTQYSDTVHVEPGDNFVYTILY
jgi:hypothetical protein